MLYDQECSVQGQRIEPFFFFSGRPASFSCLLKSGVSHQQIFQLLVFQTGRFSMKVSHMSFSIVQQPYKSPSPPPVLLQIFQILFSSLYGLMLFMVPGPKKFSGERFGGTRVEKSFFFIILDPKSWHISKTPMFLESLILTSNLPKSLKKYLRRY